MQSGNLAMQLSYTRGEKEYKKSPFFKPQGIHTLYSCNKHVLTIISPAGQNPIQAWVRAFFLFFEDQDFHFHFIVFCIVWMTCTLFHDYILKPLVLKPVLPCRGPNETTAQEHEWVPSIYKRNITMVTLSLSGLHLITTLLRHFSIDRQFFKHFLSSFFKLLLHFCRLKKNKRMEIFSSTQFF